MFDLIKKLIPFFAFLLITACSNNSPGQLEGSWKATGMFPMQITFKDGEVNEMGVISPVSYHIDGNIVVMTYEDGIFKGNKIQYIVNGDLAKTSFGNLKRIKR